MLEIAELFRDAGACDEATLRLLAVCADSRRRIAKAEADFHEANAECRDGAATADTRG
jgi:hypothetical protein